jgi:methionyl-tRNA formyltransferase
MRLIFMGTPLAALPTLARCLTDGHEIVAVWTQPDKPAGRGNRLIAPPVKEFALARNLTVHQPIKIKTEQAREMFASAQADAAVVVAYGRILPPPLLHTPRLGCINVHFSLLPRYRGAAPVNWTIINGEDETGVTTMLMDEGLDTGQILLQRATMVGTKETAPELMERLSHVGSELLSETLARLDEIEPRQQCDTNASFAPLLRREDGLIDWSQDAFSIERRVRGLQTWPLAYTFYEARRLAIWRAQPEESTNEASAIGEIVKARNDEFIVACGANSRLRLHEVQLEGKRKMSARDFLNGARVQMGQKLG